MMKKIIIILLILILLLVAFGGFIFMNMAKELEQFDKTPIDMSQVADGVYSGETETTLIKVEVEVTVADGKMTDIKILRHDCGKGLSADEIIDDMVKENTPDVDAVSGATASSEVIQDAVRKALRSGIS